MVSMVVALVLVDVVAVVEASVGAEATAVAEVVLAEGEHQVHGN